MTDGEDDSTTGIDQSADDPLAEVPDWDDEYLDRVSDRLLASFDLEKDRHVRGERFPMYGEMRVLNRKQLFHPAISYGEHELVEHLFVCRAEPVSVADLERLVDLGHELADEWIEADEQHFGTRFSFAVVTDTIPDAVREYVEGFRERTLLNYGYYGDYEINLVVVAPDRETSVESEQADVASAFRLWESSDDDSTGLLGRLLG
ncbi:MAG: hypothetical protein ABEH35_09000 [Haloarculaceae archaeon]